MRNDMSGRRTVACYMSTPCFLSGLGLSTYVVVSIGCGRGRYLQRSAALIRESVQPGLSTTNNLIDKEIRLVFTGQGPQYRNRLALVEDRTTRRVRALAG
jgi:hypothetical protein